jgi:predicted HicB family RNase H-like nuclease
MGDEKRQAFTVRLDLERHEWVRRTAYEQRVSMQRVIEEGIDLLRHTPEWAETMGERGD